MVLVTAKGNNIAIQLREKKDRFLIVKDLLKRRTFRFDGEDAWVAKPNVYLAIRDSLATYSDVVETNEAKALIAQYEQEHPPRKAVRKKLPDLVSLLKYEPMEGKLGYEDFQLDGIKDGCLHDRMLYFWSTGLGKSYILAGILAYYYSQESYKFSIVLTSNSGVYNLGSEIVKFVKGITMDDVICLPNADALNKERKNEDWLDELFDNHKVAVFSYDAMKNVINKDKNFMRKLAKHYKKEEVLLFFDEVHLLNNPKSDRSEQVEKLNKWATKVFSFSATPFDTTIKIYSIINVLDKNAHFNLTFNEWCNIFDDIGTKFSKYAINDFTWHEDEIKAQMDKVQPLINKKVMTDVIDLPSQIKHDIYLRMTDNHLKLYRKTVENNLSNYANEEENVTSFESTFMASTLVVSDPKMLLEKDYPPEIKRMCERFDFVKDSSKMKFIFDLLEEKKEDKLKGIIWYMHPVAGRDLVSALEMRGYKAFIVLAWHEPEERAKIIQDFKAFEGMAILVTSILLTSTSITVNEAQFQIFYDGTFKYGDWVQAIGRNNRIGQTRQTDLYMLYYDQSTDVLMRNAIERKGKTLETFTKKENFKLTQDDIKYIFNGRLDDE